jgi:hypothetical protein
MDSISDLALDLGVFALDNETAPTNICKELDILAA